VWSARGSQGEGETSDHNMRRRVIDSAGRSGSVCRGQKGEGNESEQEKTERMGAFGAGKRVVRGRGDVRGILVRRS
jgi:hypothetical protein